MILDEIKKANITALKEKNTVARTIYGIVSNKAMLEIIKKREKNEELTDPDMVQIIQKTIKELTEEAENYAKVGNKEQEAIIIEQRKTIEKFLPQMMSAEEIKNIILSLDDRSIGNVMKHFRTEFAGKCDMKQVGDILRSL